MRPLLFLANGTLLVLFLLAYTCCNPRQQNSEITITYPLEGTVFPANIIAPTFRWENSVHEDTKYQLGVWINDSLLVLEKNITQSHWRPEPKLWETIKQEAKNNQPVLKISSGLAEDKISFTISSDKVDAPIFYRAVPLPFKFARENLKRIRWHLGDISTENQPHAVLENIPVCANCHSFTPNGKELAMDVDARDDKGAYVISPLETETNLGEDKLIHWSDYQDGKFTYGLLSQISPNGRYIVSTLKDCEIFVDRKDLAYSQLFFPFKGILVVYDRLQKKYFELPGANDTSYVHSNPTWTPDGEYIYFTKAIAKHYEESGIKNGSVPKDEDIPRYKVFENNYLNRDSLMKFSIYKIPFNNGKGGKALPVKGASHNGVSNYFPKISPDGKWLVFCQAESFMLLQKDSKLNILPSDGGKARQLECNTDNMNSWHSWSPDSKWLVFSSKENGPFTQLYLTQISSRGKASPPILLENFSFDSFANNIPEFVNTKYNDQLKINPTFLAENDFIVRIGEIKQKSGDLNSALEEFNKAIKKFPHKSEPYFKRGVVYLNQNELTKAINDFNKALSIDESYDYFLFRGLAYLKLEKYRQVISNLKKATQLDNRSFTAHAYLGVAHFRCNEYEKAIKILERANELHEKDALTNFYLGYSYFSTQSWERVEPALNKALNLGIDNSKKQLIIALRGESRFHEKRYTEAITDLQLAIKNYPRDAELFYLLGKSLYETNQIQAGKDYLLKAKSLGSQKAAIQLKNL